MADRNVPDPFAGDPFAETVSAAMAYTDELHVLMERYLETGDPSCAEPCTTRRWPSSRA
jgi:hypothetical protein